MNEAVPADLIAKYKLFPIFRLYNRMSGVHMYTTNAIEAQAVANGHMGADGRQIWEIHGKLGYTAKCQ